jgi:hypothetical protein
MQNWKRSTALGSLLGVAAVAATVLAINAVAAPKHVVVASTAGNFAVLSRASARPAPASAVARFKALHPDGSFADARGTKAGIYVASYQGAICGLDPGRGVDTCTSQLRNGVVFLGSMIREWDSETAPFQVNLDGLASDGVTGIQVTLTSGRAVSVPVSDNAFSATLAGTSFSDITGLTIVNADGSTSSLDAGRYFPRSSAWAH